MTHLLSDTTRLIASTTPTWMTVLVGIAGAAGAILVALMGGIASGRARRREVHAAAMQTVIAWVELPYRIRRRTSNDAGDLAELRELMHDLQERLSYYQALLAAESPRLGKAFAATVDEVKREYGAWIREAWESPPVSDPSDMNLNGWGPKRQPSAIDDLRVALRYRFGLRRLVPARLQW